MTFPRVRLNEELLREGMQIESVDIPVESKVKILDALSATGLTCIEVGSFVSARYTPQMADIESLVASFTPREGVRYTALALNQRGRERMAAFTPPLSPSPLPPTTYAHLCDTFVRRNANMTQQDEMASWPRVIDAAVAASADEGRHRDRGGVGIQLRRPVQPRSAHGHARTRSSRLWSGSGIPVTWVSLADPMSWCMPNWVEDQLTAIAQTWPGIKNVHLHLHDARGMALPSIYAALRALDASFTIQLDVVAGGIGGCPYCGNGRATGMAATEDVVHMLETMGIPTGRGPGPAHRRGVAARGDHRPGDPRSRVEGGPASRAAALATTRTCRSWRPTTRPGISNWAIGRSRRACGRGARPSRLAAAPGARRGTAS